ncbi:phospholipase A2 inhibitor and Ly6/PLAUR domain-containing protein-like [Megalobrama amblycephala]|uniref:phospholipase A2 inhibitor and Ly6/PLAUR domain-containing protein-like n=1 Tax=Megalobrama amblycephala TaxID=75352 RepID=UPI00201428B7|nr:phospholipase A2 inhibitor and Ly6/PLAUR domain-containing protein-like [Megalobrama amblycephala]
MLQCFLCDSSFCEKPFLTTCRSNQYCATMRTDGKFSGITFTVVERFCILDAVCALLNANGTTFIASVGVGQTSVTSTISCCNTDGCNRNNFDAPNKTPNGLKCKSCRNFYDEQCDSDMVCVGDQDRCLNDTASLLPYDYGFGNNTLKGCISRTFCQPSYFGNVTCCEGSFCNKGVSWLSEINFSLQLLSLISIVLLM